MLLMTYASTIYQIPPIQAIGGIKRPAGLHFSRSCYGYYQNTISLRTEGVGVFSHNIRHATSF